MAWTSLSQRLDRLPLILSGPILRRTEPDAVTVWLALKASCRVTLEVYATQNNEVRSEPLLSGSRSTVALGQAVHVVAVTARAEFKQRLEPGQIYAYDLKFERYGERESESEYDSVCSLRQALTSAAFPPILISYFDHQLPTFSLPPRDLSKLQIVHGSCRKPSGGGQDALAILDRLIAQNAADPNDRPHQLFLTGDQIYGDDVADPLLWALLDAEETLLGWREPLPADAYKLPLDPNQLKPGQRDRVAEINGGFTAGLHDQPERAKSHLFSLGEFYATYLFAWSQVLWADGFPQGKALYVGKQAAQQAKQWDQEVSALQEFCRSMGRVQRSLANIPTYMIFDDHDVSDDWYLNQAWCLGVLGKPLGRRTVQNGLLAYALFQAWGNTPEQFEPGQPGENLLIAAQQWSASAGTDQAADQAIARYLGIPPIEPATGLPRLRQDERDSSILILDHDPQTLKWHYTIRSDRHEVVVLDTRTWRGYPAKDPNPKALAMLLCPSAFEQQLRDPLKQTNDLSDPDASVAKTTLVVAPTNLINLAAIDWIQSRDLKRGRVFHNDVGDAWNLNKPAFAQLLATLFEQRDRVVVLSGDIHFGFAATLQYWLRDRSADLQATASETAHLLVQLTSSAIKNSEWKTRVIHTRIKAIAPERSQDWVGWNRPVKFFELKTNLLGQVKRQPRSAHQQVTVRRIHPRGNSYDIAVSQPDDLPDWRYRTEWIKRQPAQPIFSDSPLQNRSQAGGLGWCTNWLKRLWRNRWFQEGNEVVGYNNLGVVRFESSSNSPEPQAVIQDLYWHPAWNPNSVVASRFYAPLKLEAPPASIPVVPGRNQKI